MRTRWARYLQGLLSTHPYPEALRACLPKELPLLDEPNPEEAEIHG
jgi:hypothetical protein